MTRFCRFPFLFLAVNLCLLTSLVQAQVDKHQVRTSTIGPFRIGNDYQMTVYARITHVHLRRDEADGWLDSDTLLVVVDSSGRKLLRKNATTTLGGAETRFGCSQWNIPTIGNTLMCTSLVVPTEARDGEEFQLFGLNSKRKFVPLTSPIGQFSHKVLFLDSRSRRKPVLVDSSLSYAKPAIEVEFWTGYYDAKVYFHIYPEGFSEITQRDIFHFEQIPVVIDPKQINRWRQKYQNRDFQVSLYPNPAADVSHSQNITVKPYSQVRYLYTSYVHGWWLYISIDGHKGYVSRADCPRLGFPETSGTPVMLGDDY